MKKIYTAILIQFRSANAAVRERAYEQLYREAFPQVLAYITKNSGTYEDAKEVFQEAMVAVIEKISDQEFKLSASIETYVNAVARNKWLQQLNKRQHNSAKHTLAPEDEHIIASLNRNYQFSDLTELGAVLVDEQANDDLYETAENLVIDLMESPSFSKCREVIWDYYRRKLNMQEIAQKHNYSGSVTAKSKKSKCIAKLKHLCVQIPFFKKYFFQRNEPMTSVK